MPEGFGELKKIKVQEEDKSIFVLSQKKLIPYSKEGQILNFLDLLSENYAYDMDFFNPLQILNISIIYPEEGSYINNKRPEIKIKYESENEIDLNTLLIYLKGNIISVNSYIEDGLIICNPLDDFPEGDVNLKASIKDIYGNQSNLAEVNFKIDTIPPSITITYPEDGFLTNIKDQTIFGFLSEFSNLKMDGNPISLQENLNFQAPISLIEGENFINFEAIDLAGNFSTKTIKLILDTIPPSKINTTKISLSKLPDDNYKLYGLPNSAEPLTTLFVLNNRTNEKFSTPVGSVL